MRYAVYGKFNGEYFISSFPFEQRKFAENYYESKVKISKNNGDFVIFAELNKDIILRKFERWFDLYQNICYNSSIKEIKKMTDKEKYEAVVNYIKGVINGNEHCATLYVKAFNSFIDSLNK